MNVELVANTIRGLSMDGVQQARSGHPGAPMGLADYAGVLFLKFLKYNPEDPEWPDRDRFVLSPGHASMLQYSLLHLAGYDLPIEELMNFRQWGSRTPGHPEYGDTPGVETTTGPLGQGCGNGVGMALAEAMLAERFNTDDIPLVDHYTYIIASDGDLMEGVSHEAFSLAGHLKLHKLIVFYDSNRITIEGSTDLTCGDDVRKRFEGYHWHVLEIDGHDHQQIEAALNQARQERERPTIIIGHTHIGKGSPNKQDSAESHGAPLGEEEVLLAKKALGLPQDKTFYVPEEIREIFADRKAELVGPYDEWLQRLSEYGEKYPDLAASWEKHRSRYIPEDLCVHIPTFDSEKPMATRKASGAVLQSLAETLPQLVGGSADLGPSNNTMLKDFDSVGPGSYGGRNLHFGIREHAMGSMLNGMALHGGFIVYGATFFIFSDYFRPSIRLAALMRLPVVYVFTHDSIFLGEDGPTHQAIEQLASLRAIPNLTVIRPSDPNETSGAWIAAIESKNGPTAIVLTRQDLPALKRSACTTANLCRQGAYVLWQSKEGDPDLILIASGSEVPETLAAARQLAEDDLTVRMVSMPSWELFDQQPAEVRDDVLPPHCEMRLAVEAGVSQGWARYLGPRGRMICMNRFGASAPAEVLAEKFGFTAEHIVSKAREMLGSVD